MILAVYIRDFWKVEVTGMFSFRNVRLLGALIKALRVIIDLSCELLDMPLFPNYLMGMKADLGLI